MSMRCLTFFFCLPCLSIYIYLAFAALDTINVDKIRKEQERKRREREMEAERQRVRAAEQRRMEAERQRKKEEQRRAAVRKAAQQRMEEERIKKQTLAPLPPLIDRRADVSLSEYKFDNDSGADGDYPIGDVTGKAFLNDEYAVIYMDNCNVNMNKFHGKFYHLACGADSIWAWCHEQVETLAFNPREIMDKLIVIFGIPPDLVAYSNKASSFKFMKYYFREWRKIWNNIKYDEISYRKQSAEDNLWSYFVVWFCDIRLGAIICHRAGLTEAEFEFALKPATKSNKEPSYPLKSYTEVEDALMVLYRYEKEKKKAAKRKGKNDNEVLRKKRAVGDKGIKRGVDNDDDQKAECKPVCNYNNLNKPNDEDNDKFIHQLATTAGGYHHASDGSPSSANKNNDELKESKFKQAGDAFNHGATRGGKINKNDKSKRQASGNINHGGMNTSKVQAVIKDEESNQGSKAGDKHEDVKAGDEKADDGHQKRDFDEEEEDEEWNVNDYTREEDDEDDDMSLCGRVPSETDYSLVGF